MQKNKLVQLLRTLTAEEMRQLDKFVRSPVHNKHEAVIQLFQYLRKSLADEAKLQKEKVFHALFPGQPFDMQQVHYVNSYLLKVVEEFLAWQEWRKDETSFGLYLIQSYSHRQLDQLFRNCLNKTLETHEQNPLRNAWHHQQAYLLKVEAYNYARTLGRTRDFNLQEMSDAQDVAYFVEKLKNACVLLSHQAVTKTAYDTSFLNLVLSSLENNKFLEIPAIAIYYHAYKALSNIQDNQSFVQLKKMLVEQRAAFQISEMRDLYVLAINYCIRRLNTGDNAYLSEVFDIYQTGLEIDVFLDNGIFSPWTFKNIVFSGLKLREFEKVESFITKYKDTLPEKQREALHNYNLAWLYYEKKDYSNAMLLLHKMDFYDDVLTTCDAKTLLARLYFEQNEEDALDSLLQSFKAFIRRKKIMGYHKELYLNFVQFTQRLMHLEKTNLKACEKLRQDIGETKVLASKEWLLKQIQ